MEKLVFGTLKDAWAGEATDFTPLLAQQVDAFGDAIGAELPPLGAAVVATIAVGTNPNGVSSDGTHVWVANFSSNTVSEILP